MIPIFPKFKKVSRNDRDSIISHTKGYLPYSDYNFNSLWAWDTTGDMKFSEFNGNLVVFMPDYVTAKPILSFMGKQHAQETVEILLEYADKKGIASGLTLVPESTAKGLACEKFNVAEDPDHHDYIISTKNISHLRGNKFKTKRHLANRFIKEHPTGKFRTGNISEPDAAKQVLNVLKNWKSNQAADEILLENKAIKRTLKLAKLADNELILSGVYLDGELLAFSIDEILEDGYAISHFHKIKSGFKGVSEYINQQTATFLLANGVKLWNWEQDLGIKGLKKSKEGYRPVKFLKKYKITKKS